MQVSGQLALSATAQYDDTSAVIGSNKIHAAIHQLLIKLKIKKVKIPARPYLKLTKNPFDKILSNINSFLYSFFKIF